MMYAQSEENPVFSFMVKRTKNAISSLCEHWRVTHKRQTVMK